jgi:hypothetical protein
VSRDSQTRDGKTGIRSGSSFAFCFPAELDQLDRGAVVPDHGRPDAGGGRSGRIDNFTAALVQLLVQVVDFEGDMGNGPDQFRYLAIVFEPHPFDAEGAGVEPGNMDFQVRQMSLSGPGFLGRDAEMVVSPAQFRGHEWRFMVFSSDFFHFPDAPIFMFFPNIPQIGSVFQPESGASVGKMEAFVKINFQY